MIRSVCGFAKPPSPNPLCEDGGGGLESGSRRRAYVGLSFALAIVVVTLACGTETFAQDLPNIPASIGIPGEGLTDPSGESALDIDRWTSPEKLSSTLQIMLMLTVLSLAPAVLIMTTCFVRIIVVLGLLRQAMGTQQLPPSQVITSIALFLTLLVMTPVWSGRLSRGDQAVYQPRDRPGDGVLRGRQTDPQIHGDANHELGKR